jgi:hypothetical protein
MITTAQMYWLTKLDDIRHVLGSIIWVPIAWIAIVAIVSFCAFMAITDIDSTRPRVIEKIKKASWTCVPMVFWIVATQIAVALVPSTAQMAAIVVVPRIVNNEKVQTVGNKIYDLAVEWLDELRPKKEAK